MKSNNEFMLMNLFYSNHMYIKTTFIIALDTVYMLMESTQESSKTGEEDSRQVQEFEKMGWWPEEHGVVVCEEGKEYFERHVPW